MTWTKSEIQEARKTPLASLLKEQGYKLQSLKNGNFRVEEKGDLYVKEHYWRWESKKLEGNAIDFLMLVENKTFAQAMNILCPKE